MKSYHLLYQYLAEIEDLTALIKDARDKGFNDSQITNKLSEAKRQNLEGTRLFERLNKYELTLDIE